MGISFFTNLPDNMVAAQVYIALCVAGVAVAAPQLDFGGLRSVATTREVAPSNVNEADVVSNVVSALQPSIAKAVADDLAGLQTSPPLHLNHPHPFLLPMLLLLLLKRPLH